MSGSRRTGAAVVIVIVIVAILAIAGAGVWWFVLRSTPEKTLHTMFRAQMAGDVETVRACMTERSQRWADRMGGMTGGGSEQEFEYALGETEIDGDRATVPVTMPLPEQVTQYTGQTEITLKYSLHNEDGSWKVDMQDTMTGSIGGLMGLMGGMVGSGAAGGGPAP